MNKDKDSFWVECTDQEVRDNILPLKSDADFLKEIEFNREPSGINENLNERIYTNFFLISVDLTEILSFNWVYPYAGMWNATNPFEEIELVHFDRLDQLEGVFEGVERKALLELQEDIDKLKEITNWIEENHSDIIGNIEQESIDVYSFLTKEFNTSKANENFLFQFVFRSFYRIDNAGLTPEFKKEFFNILEEYRKGKDLNYEEILHKLYAFPNLRGLKTLQFSFVTKMLNTIDDSMPIYDSKVAKMFSLSRPYQTDFEVKLDKYLHQLYKIERGYKLML